MFNLHTETFIVYTAFASIAIYLVSKTQIFKNSQIQLKFIGSYSVNNHNSNESSPITTKNVKTKIIKKSGFPTKPPLAKNCPLEPSSTNYKLNTNPMFELNPNKFLIPTLAYGPMNQMNGLFETIALSIILNRTFILPKMYRHYHDFRINKGEWPIDPAYRVSIGKLNELLPTEYSNKLSELCPEGPNAIFPTIPFEELSTPLLNYVHNFEAYITEDKNWTLFRYKTGVYDMTEKLDHHKKRFELNGKIYPPVDSNVVNLADKLWLDSYGQSNERCAVRTVPYHMYSTFEGDGIAFEYAGRNYTTSEMHSLIARFTKTPQYVEDLIAHFKKSRNRVKSVEKRSTDLETVNHLKVSVHWRFDHRDYQELNNHLLSVNLNHTSGRQILAAFDVYPGILSESILKYVQKYTENENIFIKHLSVYIASPLEEQERVFLSGEILFEKIEDSEYKNIRSASVLNSKELEKWRDWNECAWVDEYWFEVCSQMEMRLVEDADLFLHAGKTSSWSLSVVNRRADDGVGVGWDAEILKVIDEYYEQIVRGLEKEVKGEIRK